MAHVNIEIRYHPLLMSFGLPSRLMNGRPFSILQALKTHQINDEKVFVPSKQQAHFDLLCKSEPGWLTYICSDSYLDNPKHIAANIMQRYFERERKVRWLTQFDKLDKIKFNELSLVVVDALFFDTSNYKRDKIYECINHYCNSTNLSVIVIGKNTDPIAMAQQLGMQFDFALMCK